MNNKLIFLVLMLLCLSVTYADDSICTQKKLPLQAKALRTATIFNIKVYELKIFASDAQFSSRPVCYEIHYLREFDKVDVDKAWDFQFKESANFKYPALTEDITKLKSFFSEIKDEKNHSFYLSSDKTEIYENGKLKGEVFGSDFQKSFLSIWTGKNPPTKDLQEDLFKTMKAP